MGAHFAAFDVSSTIRQGVLVRFYSSDVAILVSTVRLTIHPSSLVQALVARGSFLWFTRCYARCYCCFLLGSHSSRRLSCIDSLLRGGAPAAVVRPVSGRRRVRVQRHPDRAQRRAGGRARVAGDPERAVRRVQHDGPCGGQVDNQVHLGDVLTTGPSFVVMSLMRRLWLEMWGVRAWCVELFIFFELLWGALSAQISWCGSVSANHLELHLVPVGHSIPTIPR